MLKKRDLKVGTREFFALYAMTIALQFSDETPVIIFKETKNAGWMVPILAGIFTLVSFLFVLLLLSKYKDKNMIDIIYSITGKYIGFVLCFTLFIIAFAAIVFNSRSYVDITRTMFLPRTPANVIYLMLISSAYLIARGGLKGISNTSWLFFIPMSIVIVTMCLLSFKDIEINYLYPFWGAGISKIIKSSIGRTGVYGELILFSIFFSEVKSYKIYKTASLLGSIFAMVVLVVFQLIYITVFDYVTLENMAFPFQELTMIANIEQFFTNLGSLFFGIWIMLSIIRCAILLYLSTAIFCYMLNIKDVKPLLLSFTAMIFILGNMSNNSLVENITSKAGVYYQIIYYVILLLPFVLWLLSKLRGVALNEN
jgi:spore germination protein (amino acid permease)